MSTHALEMAMTCLTNIVYFKLARSHGEVEPIKVDSKEEAVQMVRSAPDKFFGCMWVQPGFSGKATVYPRACDFYQSGIPTPLECKGGGT